MLECKKTLLFLDLYERVTSLKDVKVLLGLGGWTDSAGDKYSRLVSSDSARAKFIQKLIPFLRMHNFNGLHLDWNYPVCWQSNCKKGAASDKANYAIFVQVKYTKIKKTKFYFHDKFKLLIYFIFYDPQAGISQILLPIAYCKVSTCTPKIYCY